MTLYRIIYSDGYVGASLSWKMTLDVIRQRSSPIDSYRLRGIFPVRVERAD